MGTRSQLSSSSKALPPPSPIPTGKGSRSAVDSALSEYINQTQVAPELSLPQNVQRWVPAAINYQSLKLRDNQAIEMISKLISDRGVFLVTDHGRFSIGELRSILNDNQWIFALLSRDHDDHRCRYNEKYVWSISHNKSMLEKGKYTADREEILQILSQEMENVATKLKEIAQELSQVVIRSGSGQPATKTKLDETKLYIYRSIYNSQESSIIKQSDDQEPSHDPSKYGFSLILPLEPAEFYLQAKQLSFRTTPDTLIVTIGKDLEIINSVRVKPNLHGDSVSLFIQLNWSSSSSSTSHNGDEVAQNKISLRDQVVIVIIFALLYKILHFIIS